MTALPERIGDLPPQPKTDALCIPEVSDFGADWKGNGNYKYHEWETPDRRYKLFVRVSGGPQYGGKWTRDISLQAYIPTGTCYSNIVQVWEILEPDGNREYNVTLDAIDESLPRFHMPLMRYSTKTGGKLEQTGSTSSVCWDFGQKGMTFEEYFLKSMAEHIEAGIFLKKDLPPETDVMATIEEFFEQLKRRDFSQPKLVLKPSSVTGPSGTKLITP